MSQSVAGSRACSRLQGDAAGRLRRGRSDSRSTRSTPASKPASGQGVSGFGQQASLGFASTIAQSPVVARRCCRTSCGWVVRVATPTPADGRAARRAGSPAHGIPGVPRLPVPPTGQPNRGGCCRDRAGRRTAPPPNRRNHAHGTLPSRRRVSGGMPTLEGFRVSTPRWLRRRHPGASAFAQVLIQPESPAPLPPALPCSQQSAETCMAPPEAHHARS